MSQKVKTAMPPDLNLGGSYVIEWDAVDPVSGNSVDGVVVSKTSLGVDGSSDILQQLGPFMLVPGPGA